MRKKSEGLFRFPHKVISDLNSKRLNIYGLTQETKRGRGGKA